MKILILGSEGFIGKNLYNKINKPNYTISTVSLRNGQDLRNNLHTDEIMKTVQPDIIFNLASHGGGMQYIRNNGTKILNDNTMMSINIYKSVARYSPHSTIINALSNCSYPGDREILIESEWLNGEVHESVFSYGNSKRYLYYLSKVYFIEQKIKSINLLFPGAFGPNDYIDPSRTKALDGMIIRMTRAIKNNDKIFTIWGSGKPIREWIYVDDFVQILIEAMNIKDEIIYPINIAQNHGYSIQETADFIAKYTNFEGKLEFDRTFPDGASKKIMSNKIFKNIFPYFSFTEHELAVSRTVAYYQSEFKKNN